MGLFDKFRPTKNGRRDETQIVGISLKVRGGANPLPKPLLGAFVTGYSIASDPQEAVKQTVQAIFSMGYDVEEIIPQAQHIPIGGWSDFVASTWPEFPEHFPAQTAIRASLSKGGVVFSPFAGFDREDATP